MIMQEFVTGRLNNKLPKPVPVKPVPHLLTLQWLQWPTCVPHVGFFDDRVLDFIFLPLNLLWQMSLLGPRVVVGACVLFGMEQ